MKRVGITTTVPLEPFMASGVVPVDLNNVFISSNDPAMMVEDSQVAGYPRNICTWIKGLYAASLSVDGVVGVVRGDCSNTESLLETLRLNDVPTHPFSYPADRDRGSLLREVGSLCDFLGCTMEEARTESGRLRNIRELAWTIDGLMARGSIPGSEAHAMLVSTSDLMSDPHLWEDRARRAIRAALLHAEIDRDPDRPRLGYIGVPPIITDLYERIERMGASTVFLETQRQFSMPFPDRDWIDTYLSYTYPYSISGRISDIRTEMDRRRMDGLVHYVQSFCHRQIDDMIFRKELDIPILTIEGNIPGPMDERTAIRLEAFLDVLTELS